jgi:hypothetical protein
VYPVGDAPYSIFAADLDGDGDLDLATANYGSDNVSILLNSSVQVPALNEFGLLVLLILLMAAAIWTIKKRRLGVQRNT